MRKLLSRDSEHNRQQAGIFSVLRSYSGRVSLLIFMALAGNAVNMIIPKIISGELMPYAGNRFDFGLVILEFSAASTSNFHFYLPAVYVPDIYI